MKDFLFLVFIFCKERHVIRSIQIDKNGVLIMGADDIRESQTIFLNDIGEWESIFYAKAKKLSLIRDVGNEAKSAELKDLLRFLNNPTRM